MGGTVANGISDSAIFTGVWTNWSKGSIRGATITLTKQNGGLLAAFLALFVAVVGRSFWRLFCFATHVSLSANQAQDGLYHQRQAVLRNASDSLTGFRYFVQLGWGWRNKSKVLKIVPLVVITAALTVGFYVASIFTSTISTVSANEVLISSSKCGVFGAPPNVDAKYSDFLGYLSRLTAASTSYAQQCYEDNTAAQECSLYVKEKIPQIISTNASCPFPGKDKICSQAQNLRIDTGIVDSHVHLGMNAATKDRFTYRNILECAPLRTDGYKKIVPSSDNSTSGDQEYLFYGPTFNLQANGTMTLQWPVQPQQRREYDLQAWEFDPGVSQSTFTPIPELRRDDAVTTLFFLMANTIDFIHQVDDPFFAAHTPSPDTTLAQGPEGMSIYVFDEPVHVLGCARQEQFCLGENNCTPLTAWNPAVRAVSNMTITDSQKESLGTWVEMIGSLGINLADIVGSLGAGSLIARNTFIQGVQGPLPADQWQREVKHWQATVMTLLQRITVEHATGPSDTSMEKYVEKPSTKEAKHLCSNQKVKSASHTSFSVLGLSITFILGGIIVLLELTIEPLFRFISKRRKNGLYQRLEWTTNETLQLQRMAHEGLGAGSWVGAADSLPTCMNKDERLAKLDVSDEKHPRLVYHQHEKSPSLESNSPGSLSTQTTAHDEENLRTPNRKETTTTLVATESSNSGRSGTSDPSNPFRSQETNSLHDFNNPREQTRGSDPTLRPSPSRRFEPTHTPMPAVGDRFRFSGTPSPVSDSGDRRSVPSYISSYYGR